MLKILFIGFATLDIIKGKRFLGGAAGGMSLNAARLGVNSYLLAPLSRDEFGTWYTSKLELAGVHTTYCDFDAQTIPTCVITDPHGPGSTRQWDDHGAGIHMQHMKIPTPIQLSSFDAIIACNALPEILERICVKMKKRNLFYIPGTHVVWNKDKNLVKDTILEKTQIIFGNEEEIPFINTQHPLNKGVEIIVKTLGERGGIVYQQNSETPYSATVTKAVDTTGAGDCFSLGFTLSWLQHHDIEKAIVAGKNLSSQVIERLGVLLFDPLKIE